MTFILGSRCVDGVVLVADRKITRTNEVESITFEYKQKIFGILAGVVFGSSGSTDTFELFRDYIINEIRNRTDITYDNINIKLAEIVLDINKKRDFNRKLYFELLVAVRYPNDRPSNLTHITGVGTPQAITRYDTLGIGGIYVAHLLDNFWRPDMTMERVAGLGYFCIKYIEDYKLHSSVGIGDHEAQIHFIPDSERDSSREKIDYDVNLETRPELFTRIKKDAIKRFNKNQKGMKNLFK